MENLKLTVQTLDLRNESMCESAWRCYQAGFAGEPWNEWKRCPACDASYGLGIGETTVCPTCSGTLGPYWPIEQIGEDIRESLSLPKAHCSVVCANGEVAGLVLGYALCPGALSEQLGIAVPSAHWEVAYQDEVVVHPTYQGNGFGRLLYDRWMAWVADMRLPQVVARTLSEPPSIVYRWYRRIGYSVVAHYPLPDRRVILSLTR